MFQPPGGFETRPYVAPSKPSSPIPSVEGCRRSGGVVPPQDATHVQTNRL
ncbi:MAG: hypothetical protein LBM98_09275 [Oscillospiraceae bacterium]|nr:hypothetical protein [Oscillospiraceae bacterium]